jgi:uncharacterized membrane protein YpjA
MQLYWRLRELVLLRPVALIIMLIGLSAGVVGFVYWYGPTFDRYPVWQWIFVPDCPLFAILFTLSLGLILLKRNLPLYDAWVAFGLIKYGIWTVSHWVLYWVNTQGRFTPESLVMSISHVGMILEGLFLLSFLKMNWPIVIACGLWFGLSDWMDYGPFQTYPTFDWRIVPFGVMQWHTIAVTLLLTALYAYGAWRRQRTSTVERMSRAETALKAKGTEKALGA